MSTNPNNNVNLNGRLVRPVELYRTPKGQVWTRFTLAVNGQRKASGKSNADFLTCVLFGKWAENLVNLTDKGTLIGLTGELKVTNYEKDGKKQYRTEVHGSAFTILAKSNTQAPPPVQERQLPNPTQPQTEQTSFFKGQSIQLQADYLPEPDFDWAEDGM